jgi:hypothetical protein
MPGCIVRSNQPQIALTRPERMITNFNCAIRTVLIFNCTATKMKERLKKEDEKFAFLDTQNWWIRVADPDPH